MRHADDLDEGWDVVARAPALSSPRDFSLAGDAFLLDVDGTMVDIAASPDAVRVPPSLKRTLALLRDGSGGALALVSGRTLASLDALFAPLTLSAIACHGAEWRTDPQRAARQRAPALPTVLRRVLGEIAAQEPRVRIEDKTYTLAFHYRLAPDREAALLAALSERIAPFAAEFSLLRGKAVVEVTPRGIDKGEAVRALLHLAPFIGRRPVFFGDDRTDEDAFAVVRSMNGVSISVGAPLRNADLMAPTPHAVRLWLARIAGNTGEPIE